MKRGYKIITRSPTPSDFDQMLQADSAAWQDKLNYKKEHLISQTETFPEGTICAFVNGNVEGFAVLQLVNYNDVNRGYPSWYEITDNGYIRKTHNPHGDSLYGVSLSVSPKAHPRTTNALINAIVALAIRRNVKCILLGSRIPGYHKYKDRYTPHEYISVKKRNRYLDPELQLYLKAYNVEIVKVIPAYFEDPESCNYGVLLKWKNPFYNWPRIIRSIIARFLTR